MKRIVGRRPERAENSGEGGGAAADGGREANDSGQPSAGADNTDYASGSEEGSR